VQVDRLCLNFVVPYLSRFMFFLLPVESGCSFPALLIGELHSVKKLK
jgi:hypothetical protein